MIRKAVGRLVEWALGYEHEVVVAQGPGARLPFHKYDGDAGYDLHCNRRTAIPPHSTADVPSGVRLDPRERLWFEVKARSSTLKRKGLEVVDAVIDRDYRGEMFAIVHNPTGETKVVDEGERVVQIVPHHLIRVRFVPGELSGSQRGEQGFGSTGGHGDAVR